MDVSQQLTALIDLAESLDIPLRAAPGRTEFDSQKDSAGGAVVTLKGKRIVFLDPAAPPVDQIAVLVEALRDRPELAHRFLPPEIRELLDQDSANRS